MTLLGKLATAALVAASASGAQAAGVEIAAAPSVPMQATAFTQAGWLNDLAALPPAFAPAAVRLQRPAPPPPAERSPIPQAGGMLLLAVLLLLFAGRAPAATPWPTIQVD